MIDFKPGWRKDSFKEEPTHPMMLAEAIPPGVDMVASAPTVENQGNEGACTGFGIGGALTMMAIMLGVFTEWFSARWAYNGGRFLGRYLDQEGAYPRDVLEWLKLKGCLLESLWRYVARQDMAKPPPGSLDVEAAERPLFSYARVDNGLQGICSALASGKPVTIGAPWFQSWLPSQPDGRLPPVGKGDNVAGGHEVFAWGYCGFDNQSAGYLGCQNSWGAGWGLAGRMLIPMSAVKVWKDTQGYDAHVMTVNWTALVAALIIQMRASWDGGETWKMLSQVTP